MRVTKKQIGRPMDFLGFDGKQYHGRIVDVRRRRWLRFTYYVPGLGDVTCNLDLKTNAARVLEVW
jgi:hypothetical protein